MDLCLPPFPAFRKAEINGGHLHNDPSVFQHIERGLTQNPDGLAVIVTHQPRDHLSFLVSEIKHNETCLAWTYTQLHNAALRVAGGMLAHGARPSTSLLMLIPNGVEYPVLLWAAVILRLTIVSLDLSLLDLSKRAELRDMLALVRPSILVVQDGACAETLHDILTQDQILRITLEEETTSTTSSNWKSLLALSSSSTLSPSETDSLLASARTHEPTRTHSILFTSGTSGPPKGCPLQVSGMTHILHSQSWLINPQNSTRALQQAHNSRGIAPAQTLQTWREGGTAVMTGGGFAASDLVDAIIRYGVTFIVMTPAMVHAVAQEIYSRSCSVRVVVDSVRAIQVGGDAVTRDTLVKCAGLFPRARVVVNHGMTEGGGAFYWPFSSSNFQDIPFYGEMSPIGAVAPGAVVRIWDAERKKVVRRGQVGELHVCCGSTIAGYLGGVSEGSFYDDEEEEEERRRWFNTGDVGMMDRKGLVFILGRRKDMIRTGEKGVIMPAPMESCLESFTSKQVCVVNVEGPFAVLESFNGKTEGPIKKHVVRTLGRQYALRGVASLEQLEMDRFPVNATHKIIRTEVEAAVLKYLSRSPLLEA